MNPGLCSSKGDTHNHLLVLPPRGICVTGGMGSDSMSSSAIPKFEGKSKVDGLSHFTDGETEAQSNLLKVTESIDKV